MHNLSDRMLFEMFEEELDLPYPATKDNAYYDAFDAWLTKQIADQRFLESPNGSICEA